MFSVVNSYMGKILIEGSCNPILIVSNLSHSGTNEMDEIMYCLFHRLYSGTWLLMFSFFMTLWGLTYPFVLFL